MNPTDESDRRYSDLLFGVQRSVRYHRRRERWLNGAHHIGALVIAAFGPATAVGLMAEFEPLPVIAVVATAIAGAVRLVIGLAKKARLHSELARDFIGLERDLVRAGEEISESDRRRFVVRRLDIESKEPPVLRVLDAMCHDEIITALGYDESQRSDPDFFQRCLANIVDVGAHRLRKHASR